jgi:hypothetical protein
MENSNNFKGHIANHVATHTKKSKEFAVLDLLSLSIIVTQLCLHYNERLQRYGSKYYKHNLSRTGNLFIKELITAEENEANKLQDVGETIFTSQSEEIQDAIELLQQQGFASFKLTNKFNKAFNYDANRVMGIIDKIIEEHEPTGRNSK